MKKDYKKIKRLLYRSFDKSISRHEQANLDNGLRKYPSLLKEKDAVAALRTTLSEKKAAFSSSFEDSLMDRIRLSRMQNNIFTIKPVFRTVALSGVAAIIIVLISVYFIDGSLSLDTLMGINGYSPDMGMLTFF